MKKLLTMPVIAPALITVFILILFTGCDIYHGSDISDTGRNSLSSYKEKGSDISEADPAAESKPVKTESIKPSRDHAKSYRFRNNWLLNEHYEKHGIDMGFKSAGEYEAAASAAASNPDALHKTEKEDGDDVYYITATNEFVIISTDGYIRTYFKPDSGIKYYNKQ